MPTAPAGAGQRHGSGGNYRDESPDPVRLRIAANSARDRTVVGCSRPSTFSSMATTSR